MSMILEINAVVTPVDIGTPQSLDATPLLGGQGRNAILHVPELPITSTVLLQGAGKDADGAAPAEDSEDWETLATITSVSDPLQEIELPDFIRWNTTVLDADGPNVRMYLEGVQ